MKQRITVEQLNELTVEQKEKLREWWKENLKTYDVACYKFGRDNVVLVIQYSDSMHKAMDDSFNCLPLLSIGQMIELLRDKERYNLKEIEDFVDDYNTFYLTWFEFKEFCDAIWDEVKRAL